MRWSVAATLVALGCSRQLTPTPPTPPPPPAATVDAAVAIAPVPTEDPQRAVQLLAAVGKRARDALAQRYPAIPIDVDDASNPMLAFGVCAQPTEAEQLALTKTIRRAIPDADGAVPRFGCKDAAGTFADLYYEGDRTKGQPAAVGVWRVVRVTPSGVESIAESDGTSMNFFSEWANEVVLTTFLLIDLDGDGQRDAILARDTHEGGSGSHEVELSVWLSKARRRLPLGSFSDFVVPVNGQSREPGRPLVIRIDNRDGNNVPPRYRCIEPTGVLDLCAAIDEARRVDRASEIIESFVTNKDQPVPDREALAEMLDVLEIPAAEQAPVLASAPPTLLEVHVDREIARAIAPAEARQFGELLDGPAPPDPRIAEVMAVLGDTPCAAAPSAQRSAALARIAPLMAAHDSRTPIEHPGCTTGQACAWAHPSPLAITASCVADHRAYYAASWTYRSGEDLLLREAVVYDSPGTTTLVATSTSLGSRVTCGACDTAPPVATLDPRFHRHGQALVALTLVGDPQHPRTLVIAADGISPSPILAGGPAWYRFGETGRYGEDSGPEASDVVKLDGETALELWAWTGAWTKILTVAHLGPRDRAPRADTAADYLWHQQLRANAHEFLHTFNNTLWRKDAEYRADTAAALGVVGVDPAVRARIAAEAATIH